MVAPSRATAVAFVLVSAAAAAGCGRENIAEGRPAWASSVRLGDPAGAVNGFVEWGSYAVHTGNDSPAWLVIDLGRRVRIGEVTVFPRGDGYLDERGSRIGVEVSDDGRAFRRVGGCRELFTQAAPCSVTPVGAAGRYVLLVHRTTLVVSEVEVREAR